MFTYTFIVLFMLETGVFQIAAPVIPGMTQEECIEAAKAYNVNATNAKSAARAVCVPLIGIAA